MSVAGFDYLTELLDREDACRLEGVDLVKSKLQFTGDDLLNGENLEALLLTFDSGSLVIQAIGEDDTVAILPHLPAEFRQAHKISVSSLVPWKNLLQLDLYRAWELTNDRGYSDVLQLEFGPLGGVKKETQKIRIQLEVVASRFVCFQVHRI